MYRKTEKGLNITKLIDKSSLAINENFYLESIFLSHAIIEERLRSSLLKVNPELGGKNKIPGCIKKLNQYIKNEDYLFNIYFANDKTDNLLKNILKWKKGQRDNLIHELEKNYDLINDHDKLKSIAEEGDKLMRSLNTIVMRWKKNALKQKII